MKKSTYYLMNILWLSGAGWYFFISGQTKNIFIPDKKIWLIGLAIFLLEFVRLYIIFLERKINLGRYLLMYIRTDFIRHVLPLPAGELYRIYSFGYETSGFDYGITGIILEKYFDLLLYAVFFGDSETGLYILMTAGFITLLYLKFTSLYTYLNRFFILHSNSPKTPFFLKGLERLYQCRSEFAELLEGRGIILLILSTGIWFLKRIVCTPYEQGAASALCLAAAMLAVWVYQVGKKIVKNEVVQG